MQSFKDFIADFNQTKQFLDSGAVAKIYRTDYTTAVKVIDKEKICSDLEIEIHQFLNGHQRIVFCKSIYQDTNFIYMNLEYCRMDLNGYRTLKNINIKKIIKQLVEGLEYIHKNNIIHGDIKLQNILLDSNLEVKICDFGSSKIMENKQFIYDQQGTPLYMAPEILTGEGYNYSVDIWALGVVIYVLLTGNFPFRSNDNDKHEIFQKIKNIDYLNILKDESRSLIDGIFQYRDNRFSLEKIKNHPFLYEKSIFLNDNNKIQFDKLVENDDINLVYKKRLIVLFLSKVNEIFVEGQSYNCLLEYSGMEYPTIMFNNELINMNTNSFLMSECEPSKINVIIENKKINIFKTKIIQKSFDINIDYSKFIDDVKKVFL